MSEWLCGTQLSARVNLQHFSITSYIHLAKKETHNHNDFKNWLATMSFLMLFYCQKQYFWHQDFLLIKLPCPNKFVTLKLLTKIFRMHYDVINNYCTNYILYSFLAGMMCILHSQSNILLQDRTDTSLNNFVPLRATLEFICGQNICQLLTQANFWVTSEFSIGNFRLSDSLHTLKIILLVPSLVMYF